MKSRPCLDGFVNNVGSVGPEKNADASEESGSNGANDCPMSFALILLTLVVVSLIGPEVHPKGCTVLTHPLESWSPAVGP